MIRRVAQKLLDYIGETEEEEEIKAEVTVFSTNCHVGTTTPS
jgi:hypothetical protein